MLPDFWAIIPAAGRGLRMGSPVAKQYLPLADGRSVLEHSLDGLLNHPQLKRLVIALSKDDTHWPTLPCAGDTRIECVIGGASRAHSVLAALQCLEDSGAQSTDWVLVHDAARPNLHPDDIDHLLQSLADDPIGGLLATPAHDTLKQSDSALRVLKTLDRTDIWHALTPQMFRFEPLKRAICGALNAGIAITDEASAIEWSGVKPRLIEGRSDNFKITRVQDLGIARLIACRQNPP